MIKKRSRKASLFLYFRSFFSFCLENQEEKTSLLNKHNYELGKLLSLKRFGDTEKRERIAQDETRLGFDVDFDRIIFSSAFRSLQDKTQVIPLSETDFVHTQPYTQFRSFCCG